MKLASASIERNVAAVAMLLLVVITLANVLTRYFTDESLAWTEELSIFLMVILTLAGTASAAQKDAHLRIEAIYEAGSELRQRRLRRAVAWITALFFVFLAAIFSRFVYDEIHFGETSMGLDVPRWWYSIWIPLLCLLIAWRALASLKARGFEAASRAGSDIERS
jgi:TRAP-type C4-dicarboxylate transport system permease small subunit